MQHRPKECLGLNATAERGGKRLARRVLSTVHQETPERHQVRNEFRRRVRHAPPAGFLLAGSSSITPGVPRANLEALIGGLRFYQEHGRD